MNWLLPEHIADALPHEAATIERLRRAILDLLKRHGYEQVMPPLLEHLDSLLTGSGSLLELSTFKLVDQRSGRTLGVRADMTPQVARIDAHLLNRQGVTRLCYCGSVLHTLPASLTASREPIQLGAEIFGYEGLAADLEIIRRMSAALAIAGAPASRIDVAHVGVFRALAKAAGLSGRAEQQIIALLQNKDVPALREACVTLAEPYRSALLRLPELYDGDALLDEAQHHLPALPEIARALATLKQLRTALPDLPLSFDLADLRGYHYYNGVVFAAYHPDYPAAIARGGRYDGVGADFGRARPATGFSMDLREIARLVGSTPAAGAILSEAADNNPALAERIAALRAQGEIVIERLPDEKQIEGPWCDRELVERQGEWIIQVLGE